MFKNKTQRWGIPLSKFIFLFIILIGFSTIILLAIFDFSYNYLNFRSELKQSKEHLIELESQKLRNEINDFYYETKNYVYEIKDDFNDDIYQKTFDGIQILREKYSNYLHINSKIKKDEIINDINKNFKFLTNSNNYAIYNKEAQPVFNKIPQDNLKIKNVEKQIVDNALNGVNKLTNWQYLDFDNSEIDYSGFGLYFEPLNLIVIYYSDSKNLNKKIENQVKQKIVNLREKDKYFFLIDKKNSKVLLSNLNEFDNKDFNELDINRRNIYQEMINLDENGKNQGIIKYKWRKHNGDKMDKISFVKNLDIFDWIIGTGIFVDEIDPVFDGKKQELIQKFIYKLVVSIFYIMVIAFIILIIAKYLSSTIRGVFANLQKLMFKSNDTNTSIFLDELDFQEIRKIADDINNLIEDKNYERLQKDKNLILLNQYKNIVDTATIVARYNKDGLLTFANNAFCKLTGYAKIELINKPFDFICKPENREKIFGEMLKNIKFGKMWQGIISNYSKNNKLYHIQAIISPIKDDSGDINEYLSICYDVSELIIKEEKIKNHSIDSLTDLPNRQALLDKIKINKNSLVASFDILKFKEINEYYGYEIGDKVLVKVSKYLKHFLGKEKLELFKLSDDNFAFFGYINDWNMDNFLLFCKSIIDKFKLEPFVIDEDIFDIELVFGISSDRNPLITSEMAKDYAKLNKQSIVVFDNAKDKLVNNINLTQSLKKAINEDKIVLYKQAIVDNVSKKILRYECLVRMIDEDNNVIVPINFLNIARHSNLYQKLTKIVIEKSFKYFSKNDYFFSINLSIEDLLSPNILQYLKNKLDFYSNIGSRLTIEIVENKDIDNFDMINDFINDVRVYGCKIAIDDFGTGYSNFEYLMKLKADFIKIDGSMIKNIGTDIQARKVVELMVTFAKKLGIKTIAEYVHSSNVSKIVNELGMDASQGYFYEKPRPLED